MSLGGGSALLETFRLRLGLDGLHIVLPIDRSGFDATCARTGSPSMGELMPEAKGAIVVGDGGPEFFSRFRSARAASDRKAIIADPLDSYTRDVVAAAVGDVCGTRGSGLAYRVLHPFVNHRPVLPFQPLGQTAGLPAPGPLGIQIHPVYGPWWAYRALVIVPVELGGESSVTESCADCARPCEAACPARAVLARGFSPGRCIAHRLTHPACQPSCAARIRCPIGAAHRYPDDQLAFHMNASLAQPGPGDVVT